MIKLMEERHSVRQYIDKEIEDEKKKIINELIKTINEENNLHIQACFNEPDAFNTFMAHYGKFSGVSNYIVLIAEKGKDELIGYYGEKIVLKLQELGLNSCWVAMTYGKSKAKINKDKGEKIYCVVATGYGVNNGVSHKIKKIEEVSNTTNESPEWFKKGVEAALLAPTAMNQQKFKFIYENNKVIAKTKKGFYTKIDLGIAKYHFELISGKKIDN